MSRITFLRCLSRLKPQYFNGERRSFSLYTPLENEVTPTSDQAETITSDTKHPHDERLLRIQEDTDLNPKPSDAANGVISLHSAPRSLKPPDGISPIVRETRFLFRHTPSSVAVLTARIYMRGESGELTSSDHGITVTSLNPLSQTTRPLLTLNLFLGPGEGYVLSNAMIGSISPRVVVHLISSSSEGVALAEAFSWGLKHKPFDKPQLKISRAEDGLPLVLWDQGRDCGPGGVRAALVCDVTQHKMVIGDSAVVVLEVKDVLEPVSMAVRKMDTQRQRAQEPGVNGHPEKHDGPEEVDWTIGVERKSLDGEPDKPTEVSTRDDAHVTDPKEESTTTSHIIEAVPPGWERGGEFKALPTLYEERALISVSQGYRKMGPLISYYLNTVSEPERKTRVRGKELAQKLEMARRLKAASYALGMRERPRPTSLSDAIGD